MKLLYSFRKPEIIHIAIVQHTCNGSADCLPADMREYEVPEKLVSCNDISKSCDCFNCFDLVNDSCQLNKCKQYDSTSRQCIENRKSQKEVVILSAFLSSVGAANFLIGQYLLGMFMSNTVEPRYMVIYLIRRWGSAWLVCGIDAIAV